MGKTLRISNDFHEWLRKSAKLHRRTLVGELESIFVDGVSPAVTGGSGVGVNGRPSFLDDKTWEAVKNRSAIRVETPDVWMKRAIEKVLEMARQQDEKAAGQKTTGVTLDRSTDQTRAGGPA